MALDTRKARNIVVPATLLLVFSGFGALFRSDNRQRAQMDQKIRDLDRLLVQKRAIARDLDRYRAEVATLRVRLANAKKIFDVRLDVLATTLARDGISLARYPDVVEGFYKRISIKLEGRSHVQLNRALVVLKESEQIVAYSEIDLSETAWSITADTFRYIERDPPSRPLEVDDDVPWYSWINDDRRREIEEKEKELSQLDELIGEVREFIVVKRELEERLALIDGILEKTNERELKVRSCLEASAIDEIAVLVEKTVVSRNAVGGCTLAQLKGAR